MTYTDAELIAALDAYDAALVEIVRVLIAPDGTIVKRITTGWAYMPGYEPPTPEALIARATGHVRGQ